MGSSIRQVLTHRTHGAQLWLRTLFAAMVAISVTLSGCHMPLWNHRRTACVPQQINDVEMREYREYATEIDFPDLDCELTAPSSALAMEPRRLRNLHKDDLWDMTLQEAIKLSLSNCRILRSSGQFLSPGNPILANPQFAPSSYDIAIQETGILFGSRGVEAALAEFDTQFTTTMTWGRDEQIQNNLFNVGVLPGQTLKENTAAFNSSLQKQLATGGIVSLSHNWNYEWDNVTNQLFPSVYTGRVQAQFRQPLLAGAGVEYTRIAGPISQNIEGVSGVQQGVVIARINNDISIADFELGVINVVADIERLYWQLYLAYQQFDAESSLKIEALENWRSVDARVKAQATGGSAVDESEATELLLQIDARVMQAQNNLYDIEAQLRRMMGLPPNDGRIIRPIDQPVMAELLPDWSLTLNDALERRVELRKQKWNIKKFELQMKAAENLIRPRLDFVSSYNINGFGDDLMGGAADGRTERGLGSGFRTLADGDETGWGLGFEFSLPLGLRAARAQLRNQHVQLVKARDALFAQEIEISHELADSFRKLDLAYESMQLSINRKLNNEKALQALEAQRQATPDRVSQDMILRARDRAVQSQTAFLQALVQYNIAIMETHYRSGTLLDLDNVYLAEGPWCHGARYDAAEKAAARARTIPTATMLHTEPEVFAFPEDDSSLGVPLPEIGPAMQGWPIEPTEPLESLDIEPMTPPLLTPPALAPTPAPIETPAPEPPAAPATPEPYLGPAVDHQQDSGNFSLPSISKLPLQTFPGAVKRESVINSLPHPESTTTTDDDGFKAPIRRTVQ
ncbi:MAG: TolC family protein [Planctomycetaceae bacterium]